MQRKLVSRTPNNFPNSSAIFQKDLKRTKIESLHKLKDHLLDNTRRLLSGPSPSIPGAPPGRKKGKLIRSLTGKIIEDKTLQLGVKGSGYHGILLDRGTGLYGPHGSRIIPVRARFLKFKIKGKTIYARSVRGAKRRPWINQIKKFFKNFKPK